MIDKIHGEFKVYDIGVDGNNNNFFADGVLVHNKPSCAASGPAFPFCTNCGNGTRDGSEECDLSDLGGATCVSQGFGSGTLACNGNCTFNTSACVAASCSDGIQNQGETGIDCGGPCAACPATCSDGIQNQDETGVDCGGVTCPACGGGVCGDGNCDAGETYCACPNDNCPLYGSQPNGYVCMLAACGGPMAQDFCYECACGSHLESVCDFNDEGVCGP